MMKKTITGIVGESLATRDLRALIERVAPTDLPVLIQGPTGAGKELVAQALHLHSRRPGALAALNVCAIADTMFEDELFGHVRGAFTGAISDKPGYLSEANRGTVFLDEIGSLPLVFQSKLLRAIETRQFRPVGARRDQVSDFRVVSATNEPLEKLVSLAQFRQDLAQRLSGIIINVPPLSARPEDIPLLADHFAGQMDSGNGRTIFTEGAMAALQAHSWPGNVRELRHVIERAIVLSPRALLSRSQIQRAIGLPGKAEIRHVGPTERDQLLAILEQSGWDTARAADLLGVHRGAIYRRMQRLGVTPARIA